MQPLWRCRNLRTVRQRSGIFNVTWRTCLPAAGEIVLFDRALSEGERRGLAAHLAERYGLTLARPIHTNFALNADGEEVAWDTIRIKLQELIDSEDKNDPLSDDSLVAALAADGITLARRTITKYRKQMQIPSSRQRREY